MIALIRGLIAALDAGDYHAAADILEQLEARASPDRAGSRRAGAAPGPLGEAEGRPPRIVGAA